MTIKKELDKLFEDYYSCKGIMEDVSLDQAGNMRISKVRAAQSFEYRNKSREYDDNMASEYLEKERDRISRAIKNLVSSVIESQDLKREVDEWIGETEHTRHEEIIRWAEKVCIKMGLRDIYETLVLTTLEKEGVAIGFKRIAEDRDEKKAMLKKKVQELLDGGVQRGTNLKDYGRGAQEKGEIGGQQ